VEGCRAHRGNPIPAVELPAEAEHKTKEARQELVVSLAQSGSEVAADNTTTPEAEAVTLVAVEAMR
jgi:hypothetical protein